MRLKITLKKLSTPCNIPLNYQPYITAAIYRILEQIDPQYSGFLHNKGYQDKNKGFKYFTFSQLDIPYGKWKIADKRMLIYADTLTLTLSFFLDKTIETFIQSLFSNQKITITDAQAQNVFEVEQIEAISENITKERQTFRTLTPIVIKRVRNDGGYDYISPLEQDYEEIFISNLLSKYTAYLQHTPNAKMTTSQTLPKFELLDTQKVHSKLITVKPNLTRPIKVKGFLFDFRLTAPVDLLNVVYFGGMGLNCSSGFGFIGLLTD